MVKEALELFPGSDIQAIQASARIDRGKALDFVERRLRRHPEDQGLLKAYYYELEPGENERAEAFLLSGLDHRPVVIPWHWRYQGLAERNGHFEGLAARYDGDLKADPSNAALLYLRGRIEADRDRQEAYLRRAMQADSRLPWPREALASRAAAAMRWEECLRDVAKARELKIDEDAIEDSSMSARLATGGARDLAAEFRVRLGNNATDFDALRGFVEAVAASGSPDDVESEVKDWLMRIPANVRDMASAPVRSMSLYESGKLADCEELCRKTPTLRDSPWRLHSLLALKRSGEAVDDPALRKLFDEPAEILAVSLSWSLEGEEKEAAEWLKRGISRLEHMGPDSRRLAAMLGSTAPPNPDEMRNIVLGPRRQALACALLAERFPSKRSEYLAAAARYNVRRAPPYLLVRQAIESRTSTRSPSTAKR